LPIAVQCINPSLQTRGQDGSRGLCAGDYGGEPVFRQIQDRCKVLLVAEPPILPVLQRHLFFAAGYKSFESGDRYEFLNSVLVVAGW